LSFAVANSYDAPMLAAAEAVAADNDANVTVFDANNDPKTQYSQLQDAIQTGQYDGIITQPISSTNLIPLVEQALDEGIAVANIDQILGPDLGTAEKQVDGLNVNVTFIPTEIGTKLGEQVVAACEQNNLDPCRVGYLFDIKASALDTAIREGFDEATAGSPVEIVAEGESFFTPQGGLAAAQDMLQGNPDLNLIVGADQGLQGAQEAIGDRKVVLVGYGGSAAAKAQVSSGAWFADVAQAPGTEGREGMRLLIESIRDDADPEAVNVLEGLPADGVMKKDNAGEFDPEWPG
jgi:ribose transport system substrate-binding protein